MRSPVSLAWAVLALLLAAPVRADSTLVMFRHAEKPEQGLGQLNCQGLNRALALPNVLLAKFGKPDALFAPNPGLVSQDRGQTYHYIRPLATIEPTAIRVGLPVNTQWGVANLAPLEDDLLSPGRAGQVVFVAWEHTLLVQLAREILARRGADPGVVPNWPADDFDSLYVIDVPASGKATFRIDHQGLNGQGLLCPGEH
jgi:hypothetical protein